MATVLIVDDHEVVRRGVRTRLEAEPDFQVVGETGNGLDAIRMIEELKPDILILELMIKGINGIELIQQVNKVSSRTKTVVLSFYDNEGRVRDAMRAGARAYVLKEGKLDELVYAIRQVLEGRRYLSQPLQEIAIDALIRRETVPAIDPYETLTTREREVLQLAAQGYSNAEIAARLFISRRTAEIHRANVIRKLGLRARNQLTEYALRHGLIPRKKEEGKSESESQL